MNYFYFSAPEITEETTKTLEELILQRIKDKVGKTFHYNLPNECGQVWTNSLIKGNIYLPSDFPGLLILGPRVIELMKKSM